MAKNHVANSRGKSFSTRCRRHSPCLRSCDLWF